MSRDKNYIKFINSKRWSDLRAKQIKSVPLCEVCEMNGIAVSATEVHHIVPVESAKTIPSMEHLMFDEMNLQSLCHKCHAAIHQAMFSHTKESVRKNNERKTKRFVDKYF